MNSRQRVRHRVAILLFNAFHTARDIDFHSLTLQLYLLLSANFYNKIFYILVQILLKKNFFEINL